MVTRCSKVKLTWCTVFLKLTLVTSQIPQNQDTITRRSGRRQIYRKTGEAQDPKKNNGTSGVPGALREKELRDDVAVARRFTLRSHLGSKGALKLRMLACQHRYS
jgi:hypothetical protein